MALHSRRLTCKPSAGAGRRGGTLKRIATTAAFACAAALALAGAARTAIVFGVSDDRGKEVDPSAFCATLQYLRMTQNRVAVVWNPAQPTVIPQEQNIQQWLPVAQAAGVKIVF